MYGKQTENAIAAMSRLAEVYDGGTTRLSAADIATARHLQGPFVAKILTVLSQAGLVSGCPGPGGGYTLTREPSEISLFDVFKIFEREDLSVNCPFGGGICGVDEPCALHDRLVSVQKAIDNLLHDTSFEVFREAALEKKVQADAHTGNGAATSTSDPIRRESYRAPKRKMKQS